MSEPEPPETTEHQQASDPEPPTAEASDSESAQTERSVEPAAAEAVPASGGDRPEAPEPAPEARPEPPPDPRAVRLRLLEKQLEERESQLHEYIRAHKKAKADFDAFRERLQRDQQAQAEAAGARLVTAFLEVADNLERMLDAARGGGSTEALKEGVELVNKQFCQKLTELGLERQDPAGKPFDPATMEALGTVPVEDAGRDNTVIRTIQAGYRLKGKELRPARVQVGRKKG